MSEIRRACGMDQATLARRVRRNRVSISDVETGKLQPGSALAGEIAEVLGVGVKELYCSSVEQAHTGAVSLTMEELQVINTMRSLSEVQRAKILAYSQGLAAGGGPEGASAAAELAEAIENASRNDKSKADARTGSA